MNYSKRGIIVVRLSSLGDVAMTVPILIAFHEAYPQVEITVVSRKRFQSIFDQLPYIYFLSPKEENNSIKFFDWIRFAIQLSKNKNAQLIDLHSVLRTWILSLFFKVRGISIYHIDKGRKEKNAIIASNGMNRNPVISTFERYQKVFEKAGYTFQLHPNHVLLKKELEPSSSNIKIGIAPFAKHQGKEYSIEKMRVVIEEIAASIPQSEIFLFGHGESELESAKFLMKEIPQVINLIGVYDFEQEIEIISGLNLMIAMDSGNGHLAAMFGIPVLTIWGVTHPCLGFSPFGQPSINSILPDLNIYPHLPISIFGPCNDSHYREAINSISPKKIIDRATNILTHL